MVKSVAKKGAVKNTPAAAACPPIEGSLIQSVVLVDEVTCPEGHQYSCTSLPGHLLHLVLEGEVEEQADGQTRPLVPGNAIWYYNCEKVRGRVLLGRRRFLTVSFVAARLPPPPFDRRLWKASPAVEPCFRALLDAWRATGLPPLVRHARVFARLLDLLAECIPAAGRTLRADVPTQLWWELEAKLREDLSRPIDMRLLETLSGRSQQAVLRVCRLAVGVPPMRRVHDLRLAYSRALVLYSQLRFADISVQAGFSCSHAFSRDYHRKFGVTPTEDRRLGPDHHDLRVRDW